jgi:ABC-2 type transport system permease protein
MSKLLVLLKTYGKLYIGAFNRKKNKGELISGGALLGLISIIFVVLFTSMSMSTIEQFLKLEERDIISPLYVLTATGLIFMFLIVVLKGTSFKKSNDFDLLMSLPIKKSIVVLSKILKDYLFDLLALLLIMLPGYVCYYFMVEEASFLVVIFGIIVIVLLTFISNAIAIFINLVISKITKGFIIR